MPKRALATVASSQTAPSAGPSPSKRQRVVATDFKPVDPGVLPADSKLDLKDCEIYYVSDFIDVKTADRWYEELLALDSWYQPTLKMYGRSFLQSRRIVAFGDERAADSIKYSGTEVPLVKSHPDILAEIQAVLEDRLKTRFNHCMLNRYDSGNVHIGAHSDNPENLCIASISLGAKRDFILSHKKRPSADPDQLYRKRWGLDNGSLLVMQGDTQKYWKHEIPKQLKVHGGRISLTFRQLVDK